MIRDFLDGKLAIYIDKENEQHWMIETLCEMIKPYITSWAFNNMSLFEYLACESSGPWHFVKDGRHVNGGTIEYIRRNTSCRIVTLKEFLDKVIDMTPCKEVTNDEYYDVLFGA